MIRSVEIDFWRDTYEIADLKKIQEKKWQTEQVREQPTVTIYRCCKYPVSY